MVGNLFSKGQALGSGGCSNRKYAFGIKNVEACHRKESQLLMGIEWRNIIDAHAI